MDNAFLIAWIDTESLKVTSVTITSSEHLTLIGHKTIPTVVAKTSGHSYAEACKALLNQCKLYPYLQWTISFLKGEE